MILSSAKNAGLEIIPLVQTFAHLEWILKLEKFAHLRDDHRYATVMCVGNEEAWNLIKEVIDQVAQKHQMFGIPFFHIGADEVFQIGVCSNSKDLIVKKQGKERFILWHIARTAQYVRDTYKTRVLAWHDMFANSNEADLLSFGMTELVEPVIWNYAEDLTAFLQPLVWAKLRVRYHRLLQ